MALKLGKNHIPAHLVESLQLTSSVSNVIWGKVSLSKENQIFMIKSIGDDQCQFVSGNMVEFHESMLLHFLERLPTLFLKP